MLFTRVMLVLAAVALVAAMADTGDGLTWLQRLGGIVLGAGAWVSCNVMANLLARPLARAGWEAARTKVVTGVLLGLLMGLAAAGIAAWYGPWSALAVGAGWLLGSSLVSYAGLQSWATALERRDETGEAMRAILATQRRWAAPLDVAIAVALAAGMGLMVAMLFIEWPLALVLPAWAAVTGVMALASGRGFGTP